MEKIKLSTDIQFSTTEHIIPDDMISFDIDMNKGNKTEVKVITRNKKAKKHGRELI